MYSLQLTSRYKKQYKQLARRGYNMALLESVIEKLAKGETLDPKHVDHPLKGNKKGYRDCHITPDWVLIYKIDKGVLTLILSETGTHADLF